VILSGLYGVLRPLDRLQPYRLEMGTALPDAPRQGPVRLLGRHRGGHLNERLAGERSPVIVNLASHGIRARGLRRPCSARVVDCVFEDWKDGEYKVISFFAKRARGLMARLGHRAPHQFAEEAEASQADGYALRQPAVSRPTGWSSAAAGRQRRCPPLGRVRPASTVASRRLPSTLPTRQGDKTWASTSAFTDPTARPCRLPGRAAPPAHRRSW
jgi:hypothetical protein